MDLEREPELDGTDETVGQWMAWARRRQRALEADVKALTAMHAAAVAELREATRRLETLANTLAGGH